MLFCFVNVDRMSVGLKPIGLKIAIAFKQIKKFIIYLLLRFVFVQFV